jgi:hypothetical protein
MYPPFPLTNLPQLLIAKVTAPKLVRSVPHSTPRRETANCATLRLKDGGGFGILFIRFQEE